jgi:hypothetical protein
MEMYRRGYIARKTGSFGQLVRRGVQHTLENIVLFVCGWVTKQTLNERYVERPDINHITTVD